MEGAHVMRHWTLALVTLFATALNAAAQTADPFLAAIEHMKGVEAAALKVDPFFATLQLSAVNRNVQQTTPEVVVARLMSFDRNKDGKVTVDELSERMQGLVARGDRGGDGALDAAEIRNLAGAPAPVQVKSFGGAIGGGYTFGDEAGFSTRMHIEGVIDDLRLAAAPREKALAIATVFVDKHEKEAITELVAAMAPLLPANELKTFTQMIERTSQLNALVVTRGGPDGKSFFFSPVLIAQLSRLSLNPDQLKQAQAAVEKFKERRQLSASDRTELLAELKDVLTAEERDNLNAALARRPLVKNTATSKMAADVIRGGIRSEN
jgi:hypothetical protein